MTPLPVNRFNIESAENQIVRIKRQLRKLEETAGNLLDTAITQAIYDGLDTFVDTFIQTRKTPPTGKRYIGTFYLRKSHKALNNPEYDNITGTSFMLVDTHRWQIEHIETNSPLREGMYTYVFDSIEPEVLIDESKAVLVFDDDTLPSGT